MKKTSNPSSSSACARCGIVHEPCPSCGKTYCTGEWPWCPHGFTRSSSSLLEPVVVFRASDGSIRIPGSNTHATPPGCERIEIRDISTLAKFDRAYSEQLRRDASEMRSRHDSAYAAVERENRASLRQAMQHMTPFGRALAEHAMRRNDERRRPRAEEFEGGFAVLHQDASNREPQRDASTGWRPRQV